MAIWGIFDMKAMNSPRDFSKEGPFPKKNCPMRRLEA